MLVNSLPINTPSLRLRHIVVEEAARMMELNGEPSTRRWLPSHVYVDTSEATSRMQYLISCYSLPGDPRLGLFVHDEDTLMRFQGSQQLVSRYLWCRSIGPARGA